MPSSFNAQLYSTNEEWKTAVQNSEVRLQWDPDHEPDGNKCERRAIQLGLRGEMLEKYSRDAIEEIINISDFVAEQRNNISDTSTLITPKEAVYQPSGDLNNLKMSPLP